MIRQTFTLRRISLLAVSLMLRPVVALEQGGATGAHAQEAQQILYRCDNLQEKSPRSTIGVKLYQGYDGWFFRKSDLENLFEVSDESLAAFKRVNEALAARGIHLVLMPMIPRGIVGRDKIPNDGLLSDMIYDPDFSARQFSAFIDALRQAGIDVVDINQILESAPDFDHSSYSFAADVHWTPDGARLVAEAVARKIRQIIPEKPNPTKFETSLSGEEVLIRGNLTKALNEVCQDKVPPDKLATFKTVQALTSLDALFADVAEGGDGRDLLHIVGTSYTDEALYYNFAGFLREFLKADVSSFSVAGGGLTDAIYGWTQKSGGLAKKPKVLLWEYSSLREILKENTIVSSAIVPAIFGACSGDLEIAAGEFAAGSNFAFDLPKTGERASNYYLHLNFSNAALTGFHITYRYADGNERIATFTNPTRVARLKDLYQRFPEERDDTPVGVSLQLENGLSTSGNVQLCRFPIDAFSRRPVSN
ncbi:alginate O-acetyltransferase AlgX-related protein [Roseibium algae]|uniref:AlgX/AlgJ SGNH hydrolase-like domain-containing protein n=1 Tax=Roseibium algae TaxID=3123038 RepID=A0ABU8TSK2_9HYPH